MELGKIVLTPRHPDESFHTQEGNLPLQLVDFWQWAMSDLVENRNRGILAEFLVRQALGVDSPTRLEWDPYDFKTAEGIKIEVKSAAYIQTWDQSKYSSIGFDISPSRAPLPGNLLEVEPRRQADVYVFCLLHHKDQKTLNPMDLDQWTFFLVLTTTLNEVVPDQKSIGIGGIERLAHKQCSYGELKGCFEELVGR